MKSAKANDATNIFEVVCIEGVRHNATNTKEFPLTDRTAHKVLRELTAITALGERITGQEVLVVVDWLRDILDGNKVFLSIFH